MHAIPTKYAGVQFRSRLEARYAAFWDLTGEDHYRWEYEPLELPGWIPDFLLSADDGPIYLVEVKPSLTLVELREHQPKITRAYPPADDPPGVLLLGNDPRVCWYRNEGSRVWTTGDYWGKMRTAWREAGNVVQWRAPK